MKAQRCFKFFLTIEYSKLKAKFELVWAWVLASCSSTRNSPNRETELVRSWHIRRRTCYRPSPICLRDVTTDDVMHAGEKINIGRSRSCSQGTVVKGLCTFCRLWKKKVRFLKQQFHVPDNTRWTYYVVLRDLMFTFMSFENKIQSPKYKPSVNVSKKCVDRKI